MIYTLYESTTGHITNILHIDLPEHLEQNLNGKSAIEGNYSTDEYYIANGQAIQKLPKPGDHYQYNYLSQIWEIDNVYLTKMLRIQRTQLLQIIDDINVVRYNSLTTEQQTELKNYRQALLDVPQQLGFPNTVAWPSKPDWL